MNRLATWKALAWSLGLLALPATHAKEIEAATGDNVRITRHEDGSRDEFRRSPDQRTLTKKTKDASGTLKMMTVYRMGANGNPLSCKIFDGLNHELFKASYGYRKSDGLLVEERMFDSRVKRTDPNTGAELPVRRFIYTYDAQGNRSAPQSITLIPGKTAEEVFGPSALQSNPFKEPAAGGQANPKARPAGK